MEKIKVNSILDCEGKSVEVVGLFDLLTEKFSTKYQVKLIKNPIMKFEYVEIKLNGFIGVWVRVMAKPSKRIFVTPCMPSFVLRFLSFGLIGSILPYFTKKQLRGELNDLVKSVIINKFGVVEVEK